MTTAKEYIQNTFELVKVRNAHEAEFLQAVEFLSLLVLENEHVKGTTFTGK